MGKPFRRSPQRTVNVTIGNETFEISGNYYPGSPGTMYARNGDPGDPPESEEFEIEEVVWLKEDDKGTISIDITKLVEAFDLWEKFETLGIERMEEHL